MSKRLFRSLLLIVLFATLAVAPITFADTTPALPAQVSEYFGPVKDAEWAKKTADLITRGLSGDQTKLVVINRAIAARIEHLPEHPGMLSDRELWELGNGWCDNVARLFVTLAKAEGYPARTLELHHTDGHNGHVVAEAYYGGKWHLFDPDHGVEYYLPDGSVASFEDLQKDQDPVRATNDPWMDGFYVLPMTPRKW